MSALDMLANGNLPWAPSSVVSLPGGTTFSTSAAMGINSLRLFPVYIPNNIRLLAMNMEFTVASDAGGIVRLGVWRANRNGFPETLMTPAAGTTVAVDGAPGFQETTFGLSNGLVLSSGFYFFGGQLEVATVQPTIRNMSGSLQAMSSSANATGSVGYLYAGNPAGGFTDLPGTQPSVSNTAYRHILRTGVL